MISVLEVFEILITRTNKGKATSYEYEKQFNQLVLLITLIRAISVYYSNYVIRSIFKKLL